MNANAPIRVAAVDLGASSVRVCVCDLSSRPLDYTVVHRVPHEARLDPSGTLRWDWALISDAVRDGLTIAAQEPLASIGIDTWAVDYGLIDRDGRLLAPPVCYRDHRTERYQDIIDAIGAHRLYEIAGLQNLALNTIFQVAFEDRDLLTAADHLLTLPELVIQQLTGEVVGEITSAGSTGLVDQHQRDWSTELLRHVGLERDLLPPIREPGTRVAEWNGVPVHLVAGHDTASAVVGIAAEEPNPTFIASGSWLLAGIELDHPVLSDAARGANFTNEYGPEGTTRYLRNIAGFWILEECRQGWGDVPVERLLAESADHAGLTTTFDATDPRFLAPAVMLDEVHDAAGLPSSTSRGATVSVILNSLAQSTAEVIQTARATSGMADGPVHLIGGGVRAEPFIDRLRDRLAGPLLVGAAESAALGNAMVQGVALGLFDDVAQARKALLR